MLPPYYFYWFRIDNKLMTEPSLNQVLKLGLQECSTVIKIWDKSVKGLWSDKQGRKQRWLLYKYNSLGTQLCPVTLIYSYTHRLPAILTDFTGKLSLKYLEAQKSTIMYFLHFSFFLGQISKWFNHSKLSDVATKS